MSGFEEYNSTLMADGVSFATIAQDVGTPAYIYSASVISHQYNRLKSAMAKAIPADRQPLLCFACKANSNLSVLSHLRTLGSGLEVVSEGEFIRGLKAGFDPQKIVATGVGKQRSEISRMLKNGILQLNVESIPELEHIQSIASEMNIVADVVFRLNPNVSGGGHHKISTGRKGDKFGLLLDDVMRAYAMAATMSHVNAVGLSMHIGSQVFEVEKFKVAFEKLPDIVKNIRSHGYTVSRLDIGGGFPIVYRDEKLLDLDAYAQWVNDIIVPLDTQIIMEPGRYLVGNSGVILSRVLYVKESQGKQFLVLDTAMNDLIRPAMYDAYHAIEPVTNRAASIVSYDVVGPVCETGDTFAMARELPAIKQGDLVVLKEAGAYGASMGSNYNTRPLLPEVMTDNGSYKIIRRRQTYDDIFALEVME